jgi:hypothetical protein
MTSAHLSLVFREMWATRPSLENKNENPLGLS